MQMPRIVKTPRITLGETIEEQLYDKREKVVILRAVLARRIREISQQTVAIGVVFSWRVMIPACWQARLRSAQDDNPLLWRMIRLSVAHGAA
jgi:hypothetical protein